MKIMSGEVRRSSLLKAEDLRGEGPHPSDIEGEQDHYLFLARAFMPLSAPMSVCCVCVADEDEVECEDPSLR
jgi:hypothetical protein